MNSNQDIKNLVPDKTFELDLKFRILKGIPSSPGLAIGKAYVIQPETIIIPKDKETANDVDEELNRFESAVNTVIEELQHVLDKVELYQANVTAVIETNILILRDDVLLDAIKDKIKSGYSVESAVIQIFDSQALMLRNSKDSIISERAIEFNHIKERLISALRNICVFYAIEKGSIVVAKSVTPSDLITFKEAGVAGIITEIGGISSHSSILSRSFEIPAVIGVNNATGIIQNSSTVLIDGYAGWIDIHPSKDAIDKFNIKKEREEQHKAKLGSLIKLPALTLDDKKINLLANIDMLDDVEYAARVNADGIGLVRTENLIILQNHFPSENEQVDWYYQIAERAYPYPVTFRAFDVGSDKYTQGLPKQENNPALGFRGIRFLLQRPDLFKKQIRAVLRASRLKNVKFMLPMISSINEVTRSIAIINECKKELDNRNLEYNKFMPIGIMVETPSAALMADKFANYVDFFSIGTNDLTQYVLAADRTNELVTEIFDTFHPAVLRLIKFTIDAAKAKNIKVGICGEFAGHADATHLLIGMGIDDLSASPSVLLELKHRIRKSNYASAKVLADELVECESSDEVRKKINIYQGHL